MNINDQIKEFKRQIEVWIKFNRDGILDDKISDLENKIKELEESKDNDYTECKQNVLDNNKEDKPKQKGVLFPMSTSKDNLTDKDLDYKIYTIMTLYSNFQTKEQREEVEEMYNYLYRNKIIDNTNEIENLSRNKINTIKKGINKISKLSNKLVVADITKEGKIVYYINYTDNKGNSYIRVEDEILQKLVHLTNSNVIKVYLFIRAVVENETRKTGSKEKCITRDYIMDNVSIDRLKTVSDITEALSDLDFINKRYVVERDDFGHIREHIYYSIVSLDEYKARKKKKREDNTIFIDRTRKNK